MNPGLADEAGITIVPAEKVHRSACETGLPERPFPGLRPFRLDEWPLFFGREVMTEEVIHRLFEHQVVVVHGSSGCGKSSLIYAGVLPQLARRVGRRKRALRIAQMRPGQAPLQTMAAALAAACGIDDLDGLHRMVAKGAAGARELQQRVAEAGADRLCIFVDQFEELFRFARHGSAAEAGLFTDFLLGLASSPSGDGHWSEDSADEDAAETDGAEAGAEAPPAGLVRLIVTMRSEFLGDCARYPGLAELINRTQYLLPMMARADLVRAIREPAELFDVEVEHMLADRLVEEALNEADPLPLMQHALMRLWAEGRHAMTLARYTELAAADPDDWTGKTGLCRFLAGHANEVLESAAGSRDDPVAELLFRALTDVDAEGRGIRRPQQLGRLLALVDEAERLRLRDIVDAFRADGASFLRPFENERRSPLAESEMVDISHEALLRSWPRIADPAIEPGTGQPHGWLHREIEDGLVWRALAVQARLFEADRSACLDSATTDRRDPWYDAFGSRAAWAERHLIVRTGVDASEEPEWIAVRDLMIASRKERARDRRRRLLLRLVLGGLVAAVMLALVLLYLANRRTLEASQDQLKQVEAVEEDNAEASRASYRAQAPAAPVPAPGSGATRPAAAGSEPAFVFVGSDRTTTLTDPGSRRPVPARAVAGGRTYVSSDWLTARTAMPTGNCEFASGSGYVPRGSAVEITGLPTTCTWRGRRQYWAPARVPIRPFATVFIQFFGSADEAGGGAQAQSESRLRAARVAASLQRFGYRVPPQDRDPAAAGMAEIRYFHRGDLAQARMLLDNAKLAARHDPNLAVFTRIHVVDRTGDRNKPPPGTLELWLDVNPRPNR